jgi:hypothetical protein
VIRPRSVISRSDEDAVESHRNRAAAKRTTGEAEGAVPYTIGSGRDSGRQPP